MPSLWPLEVGNILTQAEWAQRTTAARVSQFVEQLASLPIRVDEETAARALGETLSLARSERLTTYDAAYLELTMRRGLPLATKDRALSEAAVRQGVDLIIR